MIRKLLAAILLLPSSAALAGEVEFKGEFIQGGVIFAQAEPGSVAILDNQPLRVGPDGRFIFGFDRDAPETATLQVFAADGTSSVHEFKIAQREYKIQRIDGLQKDYVSPPEEVLARIRADAAAAAEARKIDRPETDYDSGFIWPAIGPISGVYGSQRILNGEPRQPHYGVDIAGPVGTPVKAPADAVVTLVHPDMYFSGGTLIMDHGRGLSSSFLHLEKILVEEGQAVKQGDVVALMGATGRVTGAHLDWRMNWFTQRVDPTLLVPPMPQE